MDWTAHNAIVARGLDPDFAIEEVAAGLDGLVVGKMSAHVQLLGARENAFDKLPLGDRGLLQFELLRSTRTACVIAGTSHDPERHDYPRIVFRLDRTRDARVVVLVTVAPNGAWRGIVSRFVQYAYPALFPVFLRQRDVRAVFESFAKTLSRRTERLMLTRSSQLRRVTASVSRRQYATERTWTDAPFEEAFDEAREQSVLICRAHFEVCKMEESRPRAVGVEGSVAVNAYLTSTSRNRDFFSSAVDVAYSAVRAETELAHDRARRPGDARARPLVARLEEAVTREQLPRVSAILRKMPRASVSIVHGNPYLHARVVDFSDGSAFDLLLVAPNELAIVPHLRATEGAVTRLCQYVYENIGEAEFEDASGEAS